MNEAEEKNYQRQGFKTGAEGRKQVCQGGSYTRRERTLDKYHTVEPEASPQRFPLSAMNRDKAHGDASPNVITDRGGNSGVHGVKE